MRAAAFVLGFLFFGATLAGGQLVVPGLPVPVGFGLVVLWLLAGRAWVPSGYIATLTVAAFAFWLVDQPNSKMVPIFQRFAPLLQQTAFVAAGTCAAYTLVRLPRASAAARRALPALALILLLTILVAFFSGNAGGAGWMRRWLVDTLSITPSQAQAVVFASRKAIHFGFYFAVGFAATAAARSGGETERPARLIGGGFGFALAAFDELRQFHVSSRSGSAWDVGLDMLGVAAGSAVALRFAARATRKRAPS